MSDTVLPRIRDIDQTVRKALDDFLRAKDLNRLSLSDWRNFYDFVVAAFNVPREKRPSVSQLSDMLQERGCAKPGTHSVLYAHGLCILARSDGQEIFGSSFNV